MAMITKRTLGAAAWLWLSVLAAAGCGRTASEPTVRLDGAYLVVENLTGKDVHAQLLAGRQAWIPASLPSNRIEHKRHVRLRIAPSARGQSMELAWWHAGQEIGNSGIPGADKVRRIAVVLEPLPEPLPLDEQVTRLCIEASHALAQADQIEERRSGTRFGRQRLHESQCMDDAEQACFRGNECASRRQFWQQGLEQAREIISKADAR